ncbi:MAG TPA: hypothetical protein VF473_01055 [Cyclobacteriaceae bacterium]
MKYLPVFIVLISFAAEAQTDRNESRDVVMYDPLFWRDELALRSNQYRKIEEINTEFYQNLRSIKNETSRETKNNRLEQGLQERSQKIFQTLMPKQRRKLEKIIDKNAPITAP